MNKCVIPGTFDPIHKGHFAIIERASRLFDEVVVGVAVSVDKCPTYSIEDRVTFANNMCKDLNNISVKPFDNLLVDFVKSEGANCVVKGLRNVADFEYESNMAAVNSKLSEGFETLFLLSDPELKDISSSQVRELERLGIDASSLIKKS